MRLASVAVLAMLSSVALVGCGGSEGNITISKANTTTTAADDSGDDGDSGSSGDASDRDALIDFLVDEDDSAIERDGGECVADAVIDDLSADGIQAVRDATGFDLTALPDDDRQLLVDALDGCIDMDDALTKFAEGISSDESFPITADEAACAAKEYSKEYGGAGEFIEAVSTMSEEDAGVKLFSALGPCMTPESAVAFMTSLLSDQGLTGDLASCVAQAIVDDLGVGPLLEAIAASGTGGDSSVLQDASAAAGAKCATEGAGGDPSVTIPPIGGGLSGN